MTTLAECLRYEVRASGWAHLIPHDSIFSKWVGSYFAWKIRRKYRRYLRTLSPAERFALQFLNKAA